MAEVIIIRLRVNHENCANPTCEARRSDLGESKRKEITMGINKQSDIAANLQIGPTDQGMVRLFIEGGDFDIPLDFEPEEAEEIAEEIRAAAARARMVQAKGK